MQDRILKQFHGYLATPSIWLNNDLFDYPIFQMNSAGNKSSSKKIIAPKTSILGKRMEEFFRFYIENFSEEELVAYNEQIIQEKKTIGELDFLLKNPISEVISHIELVYKYYLYDPELSSNPISCWIGPNRKDFLIKKLERLTQRQFPLLYHPATAPLLKKLGVSPQEVVQKLCFKANLFLPFSHDWHVPGFNPAAFQGYWMKEINFTSSKFGEAEFYSPQKQDWPVLPKHHLEWYSYAKFREIISTMLSQQQSPLVWMKTPDDSLHRFFIVWW